MSSRPYVQFGAKLLTKGRVELAHHSQGYQLPGECLVCFAPEEARRGWRAESRLAGSGPGVRYESIGSFRLELSLPYCTTHAELYDTKTAGMFETTPGFTTASVPGFGTQLYGDFDEDRVRGVRVELRFGEGAYARKVAESNTDRILEILASPGFELPTRVRAGHVLGELGDARAAGPLAAVIREELYRPPVELGTVDVVDTSLSLVRELGRLGRAALDPLTQMLGVSEVRARVVAIAGLGHVGLPGALDLLVKALEEDPEAKVRAKAANALGRYVNQAGARVALEKASSDPSRKVRKMAKHSLKASPGPVP